MSWGTSINVSKVHLAARAKQGFKNTVKQNIRFLIMCSNLDFLQMKQIILKVPGETDIISYRFYPHIQGLISHFPSSCLFISKK